LNVLKDVRLAALEAIVDYTRTDGKLEDVEYLLDIIETDIVPAMKHDLCRLIIQCLTEKTVRSLSFIVLFIVTNCLNVIKISKFSNNFISDCYFK